MRLDAVYRKFSGHRPGKKTPNEVRRGADTVPLCNAVAVISPVRSINLIAVQLAIAYWKCPIGRMAISDDILGTICPGLWTPA